MKQSTQHPSGGKLRGLFCIGLAAVLAASIALNGAAANTKPVQYDMDVWSSSTHTAVLSDGDLYFWGTNDGGQFPGSDLTYSPEPVRLLSGVKDAAVSENRTLVVASDGTLTSYGFEPADGTVSGKRGTVIARDAAQVEACNDFAAYISKDGSLYTWGRNDCGELGTGNKKDSSKPVKILTGGVQKVSLGTLFGMALMKDGTLYGWGVNEACETGYLENGSLVTEVLKPVKVAENVADISTGSRHSCVLKKDGTLWVCGSNTFCQTGFDGGFITKGLTKLMDGVRSVSAGSHHSFAVSNDGSVYAWGHGLSGQLGSGNGDQLKTPTVTSFDFVQVFACYDNTFGISSNGDLYSFGDNTNYRLGKSDGSDSMVPMPIVDKDMNWIYPESIKEADPEHAVSGPETSDPASGTESGSETKPGNETKPLTVVTTPFVDGFEDGTFQPEKNVTRAQFVKMLVSALCEDFNPSENYGTPNFDDIPMEDKWYEDYLAYAQVNKLVDGYPDGTFRPDNTITRAEAAKIAASFLGLDVNSAPAAEYPDVAGNYWAASYINALTAEGILAGNDQGYFQPEVPLTRAQAAKMIAVAAGFRPTEAKRQELAESMPNIPFTDVTNSKWYYAYLLRAAGYVE